MAGIDLNSIMQGLGGQQQGNSMFGNLGNMGGNLFGTQSTSPFGGQFDNTDMFGLGNFGLDTSDINTGGNMFGSASVGAPTSAGGDGLFGIGALNSSNLNDFSTGLDAVGNLFNLYAGMKGLGIAEDRNDLMKTNLSNNANLTNERLGTRQASRLRSQGITGDANAAGVADFMKKYSVSGG